MELPKVQESDTETVKAAITNPISDIDGWMKSLPLINIQNLDETLELSTNGGNQDQTIRDILKHDMIYAKLEDGIASNIKYIYHLYNSWIPNPQFLDSQSSKDHESRNCGFSILELWNLNPQFLDSQSSISGANNSHQEIAARVEIAKNFRKSSFKTEYLKYNMISGKNKPSKFATAVKTTMKVKEAEEAMEKKIQEQKKADEEAKKASRWFWGLFYSLFTKCTIN